MDVNGDDTPKILKLRDELSGQMLNTLHTSSAVHSTFDRIYKLWQSYSDKPHVIIEAIIALDKDLSKMQSELEAIMETIDNIAKEQSS